MTCFIEGLMKNFQLDQFSYLFCIVIIVIQTNKKEEIVFVADTMSLQQTLKES